MRIFPVKPKCPEYPQCPHLHRAWTTTANPWGDEIEVEVCMDCGKIIDTAFDLNLLKYDAGDDVDF
ncbi:MAG: hypothetical protein NTW32_27475 [Chloroflexi bacterium]|nr:hypothetical protein [Chloroflexota bacterium]